MKNSMKSPVGFNGNALWPLVALLVAGVAWIQSNTDFKTAAYAIMAVGGVLFVIVGFLLALGAKRITFDSIIGLKEAESRIEAEREKSRRQETINGARFEQKLLGIAAIVGRQIGANYKAQVDAQNAEARAGQKAPEENPFLIDLGQMEYNYRDDEL